MEFQVTRRQVIKALRTEPLRGGHWVHLNRKETKKFNNNTGCAVCAVGAILDCSLGKTWSPSEIDKVAFNMVRSPTVTELREDKYNYRNFDPKTTTIKDVVEAVSVDVYLYPLSSLSSLFEFLMSKNEMKKKNGMANIKARKILINFVKKHFPVKMDLNTDRLNGY